MRQQTAPGHARSRATQVNPLRAPRPFAPAQTDVPSTAGGTHDFGSVAVGASSPAPPAGAPIQRQLRRRVNGRFVEVPRPEESQVRSAPSYTTQIEQEATRQIANARQQPSTLLPYAASAVSTGASLIHDNPVSTVINAGTTAQSMYTDARRGIAEFGNAEYRNSALSAGRVVARGAGFLGGLFHVPGSGAAATVTAAALGQGKKKLKTE